MWGKKGIENRQGTENQRFALQNKKGIEWELGKIILALVLLVLLIFGAVILIKGKGGEILEAVKNIFRFGKGVR